MNVENSSLSYKQRKAVFYLAAYNWTKRKVAEKVGVSTRMLNSWLETEEFNTRVEEKVAELNGIDKEYRLENAKKSLPFLYDELLRRLAIDDDEVKEVPMKDIVKLIGMMQKEIRLDTPGDATQKVEHFDLGKLSKRFMKSTSAPAEEKKTIRGAQKDTNGASPKKKRTAVTA